MSIALDLSSKQAAVNAVIAVWNTGAGSGGIDYLSATSAVLASQVLATWAAADGSGISVNSPIANTTVSAVGTNTVTAFRVKDKNAVQRATGTVTANGGGGDITFDNVSWSQNGTVSMSAINFTTS